MIKVRMIKKFSLLTALVVLGTVLLTPGAFAAQEQGSVGLEGKISSPPPTTPATITFPRDGTVSSEQTITVTGICPNGLLVKIFKNNVFSGAAQCNNGSYSVQIDLFTGLNELVARVYDDLDQAGPDSNIVKVTVPATSVNIGAKISITSSFAKKGANPGQKIVWPITISGGNGPYAITVDWGDGKTADIISQTFAGTFNIEHVYDNPGIYNVIIRAVDKDGNVAFLQLVGVGNGEAGQNVSTEAGDVNGDNNSQPAKVKVLWLPALISIPLIISTFYVGRKYELRALRKRLEQRDEPR